jgi:hypothetical protein
VQPSWIKIPCKKIHRSILDRHVQGSDPFIIPYIFLPLLRGHFHTNTGYLHFVYYSFYFICICLLIRILFTVHTDYRSVSKEMGLQRETGVDPSVCLGCTRHQVKEFFFIKYLFFTICDTCKSSFLASGHHRAPGTLVL